MFEYAKGYEIDGSDTSYYVIVSEFEACVEILEYYLRLKVVHKNAPITVVKADGMAQDEIRRKEYKRDNLHELWDCLRRQEITCVELEYKLVQPNSLYPEVKRELLEEFIRLSDEKPALVAPEFRSSFEARESIVISLTPEAAENTYRYSCCACGDDYVKEVIETPYFAVEFYVSVNAPHVLHYYSMKKLSEAFPNLKIEYEQVFSDIIYYNIEQSGWLDHHICERIEIFSGDYRQTLKRLAAMDEFEFYRGRNKSEGDLDLANVSYSAQSKGKYDFEYIDVNDDSRSYRQNPAVNIFSGIFRKSSELTIDEYVEGVLKLAEARYFTDEAFVYYTTLWCKLLIDDKAKYGYVKFERRSGGPVMILSVPWRLRGQAIRIFGI